MNDFELFVAVFGEGGIYDQRYSLLKAGEESQQKVAQLLIEIEGHGQAVQAQGGAAATKAGVDKAESRDRLGAHVLADGVEERLKSLAVDNKVAAFVLRQLQGSSQDFAGAIKQACQFLDTEVSEAMQTPVLLPVARKTAEEISTDSSRYSSLLNHAGIVSQAWPGHLAGVPNSPGPLSSMLVLAALGGGAGNLTARGLNKLRGVDDPKTRRRATAAGALLGLLPGLGYAGLNMAAGQPAFSGRVLSVPMQERFKQSSSYPAGNVIPVDKLRDMIWDDPWVANRMPLSLTAATSALVEGANRKSPHRQDMPFVTPGDVGRMAVGLGSGYASGLMVGKALGALFGVSDSAQQILRRSGAAAGLLKAFVPMAYNSL